MEKVISWIKKNKKKLIILSILLIIFITLVISYKKVVGYLSPSTKKSVYGDRCSTVLNLKITKDEINAIKTTINAYEGMEAKEVNVECKLINITVNLKTDQEFTKVEEMSKAILKSFKKEKLENYDIQLFITSSNKDDINYPKIGTHHKLIKGEMNDNFVW